MDKRKVVEALNQVMQAELSGMLRYLHQSFLVFGFGRDPVVEFLRERATEAMDHAIVIGEKITALGGMPTLKVSENLVAKQMPLEKMLRNDLAAEREALKQYTDVLALVSDDPALETLLRQMIKAEQDDIEQLEKYLRRPTWT